LNTITKYYIVRKTLVSTKNNNKKLSRKLERTKGMYIFLGRMLFNLNAVSTAVNGQSIL